MSDQKSEATFFKEDVEKLLARYSNLSVYATVGALEVVKLNLLERLGKIPYPRHVIPLNDLLDHGAYIGCGCNPIELEPGLWVHNARDGREKYERQDGQNRGGWEIVFE